MDDKNEGSEEDYTATFDQSQIEPDETPDIFLTRLFESLTASPDVDAGLARILSDHLLSAAPDANAVANAKAAIDTIAVTRAAQTEEQNDD